MQKEVISGCRFRYIFSVWYPVKIDVTGLTGLWTSRNRTQTLMMVGNTQLRSIAPTRNGSRINLRNFNAS